MTCYEKHAHSKDIGLEDPFYPRSISQSPIKLLPLHSTQPLNADPAPPAMQTMLLEICATVTEHGRSLEHTQKQQGNSSTDHELSMV